MTTLVTDEYLAALTDELGISNAPQAAQREFLAGFGKNVMTRLTIEVLALLPEGAHAQFREMLGTASQTTLYEFLSSFISDVPALIERVARDELAETKKLLGR